MPPTPPRSDTPIATREYGWRPATGPSRKVTVEIHAPVQVTPDEWTARVRITGLANETDMDVHAIDGVQALELALVGAGARLSASPAFLAGELEVWGEPTVRPADLMLPLPLQSLQMTLEMLNALIERERALGPQEEFRAGVVAVLREVSAGLARLDGSGPAGSGE